MLKKLIMALFVVLVAVSSMPSAASAFLGKLDVVVDGKPLQGNAVVKNKITFVPFRELFNELGLAINYNSKTNQVTGTKSNLKVTFTIGSKTAYVNGQKKALQAAPFSKDGSVYVPLRIVGESTGSQVVFFQDVQIVLVNSPAFDGLVYDGEFGSLSITADGKLKVENLLVLDEFLSFSQEEEVVYFKEISNEDESVPFTSLTPDSEVVPAE
ncbi:copper amine oxidase-like protein [Fontibacillus phaseoli]|uniref:Copper amine oxidase-like protein n=1 Tax=Fontibacillus phaseoli TaxID=1416533 RepID=A0A369BT08_9BACL|nr:copper amine oxidase N-terminal domain-containing protein [Fontibacillus phaseoli]RCX23818.1 copper amine oxidase-like protein [Fontibacillus phaseoli]